MASRKWSCLAIRSPSCPHETAWSPKMSLGRSQAGQSPGCLYMEAPSLYLATMTKSCVRMFKFLCVDGTAFSQAPALGRPRLFSRMMSRTEPDSAVCCGSWLWLCRSMSRLSNFWDLEATVSLVTCVPRLGPGEGGPR